jgi:Transcription factor zinc-finger
MNNDHPMRTPGQVRRRCPRCNEFMYVQRRGPVAHIQVQACFDCKGLWADCGKLDELDESGANYAALGGSHIQTPRLGRGIVSFLRARRALAPSESGTKELGI